jgi:hypothetical protein
LILAKRQRELGKEREGYFLKKGRLLCCRGRAGNYASEAIQSDHLRGRIQPHVTTSGDGMEERPPELAAERGVGHISRREVFRGYMDEYWTRRKLVGEDFAQSHPRKCLVDLNLDQ